MNIRIVRVDLSEVEAQLQRIADLLEGILGATNPLNEARWGDFPAEEPKQRVFYTDERQEIVDHMLHKLGKRRE